MFSAKINHVVAFQLGWSQSFVITTNKKKESLQTAAFGMDVRIISEELKTSERNRSEPGGGGGELGGLRAGGTEDQRTEYWGAV